MSTERKPGSRGVLDPFARDRANPEAAIGKKPAAQEREVKKGSTKTQSPSKSFKKKPRKKK